jgi:hypothetical protein
VDGIEDKVATHLATRYGTTKKVVRKYFKVKNLEQWRQVRRLGSGDVMTAASMVKTSANDRRDATFVRVSTLFPDRVPIFTFFTFFLV